MTELGVDDFITHHLCVGCGCQLQVKYGVNTCWNCDESLCKPCLVEYHMCLSLRDYCPLCFEGVMSLDEPN